ncbi:serine hydrolase [Acetobacter estunensis]|uniref:serine hydrolase domain-containing protein n=1 Tax=Acetobacter estunensis TaxID=104097 RepID=UPI001C2CF2DD|nr:serine hydrolase domain-containing protein [Acetobacter estunensis]MBV1835610.1 beta-lactamase family protein [Acetobacter estunensis]MBV1836129.1 beta-lactamase family protein [Acetobacter estunensis]
MYRRTLLNRLQGTLLCSFSGLAACATPSIRISSFMAVDRLVDEAIARKDIPGAVVAIGHEGKIVHRFVAGHRAIEPNVEPMTWDTHFDMASLTKATITAPALMQFWEKGLFQLDDPVARYLPAFGCRGKEAITIRQLLTHFSGLPPDLDLSTPWNGKESAIQRAMTSTPTQTPGTRFVYSDINYIVLGLLVEAFSNQSLDGYAQEHILTPLGMSQSGFMPSPTLRALIAPTQYDEHHVPLRGVVHDPTARRMGGVAGHAGLFSTADDMTGYAANLLARRANRPSLYPLRSDTVRLMTSPQSPVDSRDVRGLGWDIATHYSTPRGDVFPIGSFGHTGYTGTSLWMDPTSDSFVLILTNRVHPLDIHGKAIVQLRRDIATAAARALLST